MGAITITVGWMFTHTHSDINLVIGRWVCLLCGTSYCHLKIFKAFLFHTHYHIYYRFICTLNTLRTAWRSPTRNAEYARALIRDSLVGLGPPALPFEMCVWGSSASPLCACHREWDAGLVLDGAELWEKLSKEVLQRPPSD